MKLQRVAQYEIGKLEDLRKFSPKGDGKLGNAIIKMAKSIAKGGVSKQTTFLSKLDRIGLVKEGMDLVEQLVKDLLFRKTFGINTKTPAEMIEQAGMMQKRYLQWRDRREFKARQLAKFSQYKEKYSKKDPLLGLSMSIDQTTEQILKLSSLLNLLVVDLDIRLPVISSAITEDDFVNHYLNQDRVTAELELGNIALSMDEMGAKRHKIKILQFGVSTANNNIMSLCSQLGVDFLSNSRN